MERRDNYLIQMGQAKVRFLGYDQEKLIQKFQLKADESYLYPVFLGNTYRICRKTGDFQKLEGETWADGNSYGEVMTLLDLLCDSRDDRYLSGRWKNTQAFGLQFHRNLLEDARDSLAVRFDQNPELLAEAKARLGGRDIPGGDVGFSVELFDGLRIGILFWHGDEEFAPRLRFLWDENAHMYLRYETMHFALGLLRKRLLEIQ